MTVLQVLGRSIVAHQLADEQVAYLRDVWSLPGVRAPSHPFVIEIRRNPAAPPAPRGEGRRLDEFDAFTDQPVFLHSEATSAFLGNAWGGVSLRLAPTRAALEIWGEPCRRIMLTYAVQEALRYSGLLMLHASCAARGDVATIFLGQGGSGKTTTLLLALQAGWRPICEDIAWVDPHAFRVFGWEAKAGVRPGTLPLLGDTFARANWGEKQNGKYDMSFEQLSRHFSLGAFRWQPARLVRVGVLDRRPTLSAGVHPIRSQEARIAIWRAAGMPLTGAVQRSTKEAIEAILDRLEVIRLRVGRALPSLRTEQPV